MAYAKSSAPPARLKNQNALGTTLLRARSLAIHCTRNLAEKSNWAVNPRASQNFSMMIPSVFDPEHPAFWYNPDSPGIALVIDGLQIRIQKTNKYRGSGAGFFDTAAWKRSLLEPQNPKRVDKSDPKPIVYGVF